MIPVEFLKRFDGAQFGRLGAALQIARIPLTTLHSCEFFEHLDRAVALFGRILYERIELSTRALESQLAKHVIQLGRVIHDSSPRAS